MDVLWFEFIISSTFFVVLTALQSVSVHVAARRVAVKRMVVRNFVDRGEIVKKRRSRGIDTWLSKLSSIRRRIRVRDQDQTRGAAGGDVEGGERADGAGDIHAPRFSAPAAAGRGTGETTITTNSSTHPSSLAELGDGGGTLPYDDRRRLPPLTLDGQSEMDGGGGGPTVSSAAQSGVRLPEDDDDNSDAVSWENVNGNSPSGGSLPSQHRRSPPQPPPPLKPVGLFDIAEHFIAFRLDPLSLVLFPLAYFMNMMYIFVMEHERK